MPRNDPCKAQPRAPGAIRRNRRNPFTSLPSRETPIIKASPALPEFSLHGNPQAK
jgi:hypothetical protein